MNDRRDTHVPKASVKRVRVREAGPCHQVVTVEQKNDGRSRRHCKRPCADCPWRIDATGKWPPEAFVASAETAYDMASHTFACHSAGADEPRLCAGFLLRDADHNLSIRLDQIQGYRRDDVTDGGHALHPSYRDMAIANGVDAQHPALQPCRSPHELERITGRSGQQQ